MQKVDPADINDTDSEAPENNSPTATDVTINIEVANNGGCMVRVADADDPTSNKKYVYPDLEAALKEIPSIVSVLEQDDSSDMEDMKNMLHQKPMGTTMSEMRILVGKGK